MIMNNKVGPVQTTHIPLDQGRHRSVWVCLAELGVLAGRLPVAVVDLADSYTDYMVAAAEVDTPGGVHYRTVGMAQVDHYCTVREKPMVMPP
jgi:hypothetical protein